jgi:16S rRNA (cytosine967-C5)-methyltransferase
MTPGARVAAAIAITDRILGGEPAEKALTNWARASRFAGSGDRRAVRDLVYDGLRRQRSCAWVGGALTGRGVHLGQARLSGQLGLWTGEGHAPPAPDPEEGGRSLDEAPAAVRADLPDWLMPLMGDHGPALRDRAPLFLRVNPLRADSAAATTALAEDGIVTVPHPVVTGALQVVEGGERVERSAGYLAGLVEVQDASAQAAVLALGALSGLRVLDYCAGGGGKALAMAAQGARVTAWDANPRRMADLPQRAARAGVDVTIVADRTPPAGPFDLVLCDAPCSGSGTWRRTPDMKWRLDPDELARLTHLQAAILDRARLCVAAGGRLAYATCSVIAAENRNQISGFADRHSGWGRNMIRGWDPGALGDGFFLCVMMQGEQL